MFFLRSRNHLITSTQINIHPEYRHELEDLAEEHPELLVLNRCSEDANSQNSTLRCKGGDTYSYPEILEVCFMYCLCFLNLSFSKQMFI